MKEPRFLALHNENSPERAEDLRTALNHSTLNPLKLMELKSAFHAIDDQSRSSIDLYDDLLLEITRISGRFP